MSEVRRITPEQNRIHVLQNCVERLVEERKQLRAESEELKGLLRWWLYGPIEPGGEERINQVGEV